MKTFDDLKVGDEVYIILFDEKANYLACYCKNIEAIYKNGVDAVFTVKADETHTTFDVRFGFSNLSQKIYNDSSFSNDILHRYICVDKKSLEKKLLDIKKIVEYNYVTMTNRINKLIKKHEQ